MHESSPDVIGSAAKSKDAITSDSAVTPSNANTEELASASSNSLTSDSSTSSDGSPAADVPKEPSSEGPLSISETIKVEDRKSSASTSEWLVWNIIAPLAVIAAAVAVVFALGTVEPEKRPPADTSLAGRMKALTPVRVRRTTTLEALGKQLELRVDGTVVPFREVQIATEVAGRIIFKSDKCEAGSFVEENDLLMQIDPTDYELEVQRLTRLQEQEYEALGEVDQEMANTQRLVDVAKEDEALQKQEVDRLKSLPDGFASKGEVDKAKRTLLQARQQTVSYENQFELLKKRRSRLEASERLAATQLAAAKVNLRRTDIRSPINGVIINEDAELNTFVARGSTIVTIEDTSKAEVATSLRMDQLYWVLDQKKPDSQAENAVGFGQTSYDIPETNAIVEFSIAGRGDKTYQWNARLLSYDGIGVDGATRTVPVRIVVDRPRQYTMKDSADQSSGPTTLVRGMFVNVRLLIAPKTPLVVIPAEALKPGNRVWQFVPDETVILDKNDASQEDGDLATQPTAPPEIADNETDANQEAASAEEPEFEPEKWQAGRVMVREQVFPVDSLSFASNKMAREESVDKEPERQWWVCEVRGREVEGDSWVVVSPISSSDSGEIKARMLKPEFESQSDERQDDQPRVDSAEQTESNE